MVQLDTEFSPPVPLPPTATPVVQVKLEPMSPQPQPSLDYNTKLDNLEMQEQDEGTTLDMDRHMTVHGRGAPLAGPTTVAGQELVPLISVKDEPNSEGEQQHTSGEDTNDSTHGPGEPHRTGSAPKTWTQQDMDNALDALRKHNMSLTKASSTFGIPSTTLWQRAHRLGIDTPKKDGCSKTWSECDLHSALHALRAGAISANKASKAYGIPSSTLYKIARREGIRLAAPFNAAPTAWRPADLARALHDIRHGGSSVQRASAEYGIPTGTLYGRCKREGIELSRSNPTPWSEDAMGEALEAVRVGQMSINQAAIHYNLPYSSLYGRFKRCRYEDHVQPLASHLTQMHPVAHTQEQAELDTDVYYPHPAHMYDYHVTQYAPAPLHPTHAHGVPAS